MRAGTRFEDEVARTAWPIELHDRSDGYVWEMSGPDHVHYVPLRAMTPPHSRPPPPERWPFSSNNPCDPNRPS